MCFTEATSTTESDRRLRSAKARSVGSEQKHFVKMHHDNWWQWAKLIDVNAYKMLFVRGMYAKDSCLVCIRVGGGRRKRRKELCMNYFSMKSVEEELGEWMKDRVEKLQSLITHEKLFHFLPKKRRGENIAVGSRKRKWEIKGGKVDVRRWICKSTEKG